MDGDETKIENANKVKARMTNNSNLLSNIQQINKVPPYLRTNQQAKNLELIPIEDTGIRLNNSNRIQSSGK